MQIIKHKLQKHGLQKCHTQNWDFTITMVNYGVYLVNMALFHFFHHIFYYLAMNFNY
jgi:hypothetical protein